MDSVARVALSLLTTLSSSVPIHQVSSEEFVSCHQFGVYWTDLERSMADLRVYQVDSYLTAVRVHYPLP